MKSVQEVLWAPFVRLEMVHALVMVHQVSRNCHVVRVQPEMRLDRPIGPQRPGFPLAFAFSIDDIDCQLLEPSVVKPKPQLGDVAKTRENRRHVVDE